jgi:hypothetical protein
MEFRVGIRVSMLRILTIIMLAASAASAAVTADFIVLASPDHFSIYNAYQQPLSEAERALMPAFSPLQIIRLNDTLGDGITPAARCRFGSSTLYLLTDGRRGFIGDDKSSYHQILKGCILLGDTVETSAPVRLYERYPGEGRQWNVERGTVLEPLFQYKEYLCLITKGARSRFGWCARSSQSSWHRVTPTPAAAAPSVPSEAIAALLSERIAFVNATYQTFFDHFNQATGQQRTVPAWQPVAAGSVVMTWRLNAPYGATHELDESTQYLVKDLENVLIGKPFRVSFQQSTITVVPEE